MSRSLKKGQVESLLFREVLEDLLLDRLQKDHALNGEFLKTSIESLEELYKAFCKASMNGEGYFKTWITIQKTDEDFIMAWENQQLHY